MEKENIGNPGPDPAPGDHPSCWRDPGKKDLKVIPGFPDIFVILAIILYSGASNLSCACSPRAADEKYSNSINGKIICGYQGWFNAEGDGAGLDWKHYRNNGRFEPGSCSVDMWPDMTEYGNDERFVTPFRHADGSPAYVFSSAHPKTVDRHFRWMKEYGIDGVFVQRFVSNVRNPLLHANMNKVFDNCFNASERHGRLISVMFDLSGSRREVVENTKNDWKQLVDKYGITNPDKRNVLTHNGKPVVAIWGMGFNDGRQYTLDDIHELIVFLKMILFMEIARFCWVSRRVGGH